MTDLDRAYVLGPGESVLPGDANEYMRVLVGGEQSRGQYALLSYTIDHDAAPHVHELEDESVFVTEGEITVAVGPKSYELGPGGFVFMPRGVPHAITLHTPTLRGFSVSAPGGVFDSIIRDRTMARAAGETLDEEALWRIRERYGMRRVTSLTEGLDE
jgi:quercetin dioxygenase-like cupin family protein